MYAIGLYGVESTRTLVEVMFSGCPSSLALSFVVNDTEVSVDLQQQCLRVDLQQQWLHVVGKIDSRCNGASTEMASTYMSTYM